LAFAISASFTAGKGLAPTVVWTALIRAGFAIQSVPISTIRIAATRVMPASKGLYRGCNSFLAFIALPFFCPNLLSPCRIPRVNPTFLCDLCPATMPVR
jgi:hypothetical protein